MIGSDRRRALLVLTCTSMPSFMLQLDANIVSVSLPAIAHSLHATFAGIEWVISAYMLSFASLLMPAGALADRFGRKNVLLCGLFVFTAASWLCGAAGSLPMLVAARAVQGAGAAMQLSAALATLSHVFQGKDRARAFAFWGSVVGIGIASGPVVGGVITQAFGWQWAFYVNVPIGIALILLIGRVIESTKDPHALRIDVLGVLTFASALFLLTLALIEGNSHGWASIEILLELAAALALFALFVIVESQQPRPMLDLSYFRRSTYIGANLAQLSFSAGMLTMLTYIPIFLQRGLQQSSGAAGLRMLPMVVPLFFVPRIVSRYLAHRLSGRALLTGGLALVGLGLFWFAAVVTQLDYALLVVGMVITGVGAGILNGETTKVGMSLVPKERSGMASGVSGTVRFTGLVVGIAALGVVLYSRVDLDVHKLLPEISSSERSSMVQAIAAGNLPDSAVAAPGAVASPSAAVRVLAQGYQALFFAAALYMTLATLLTWRLVRTVDTLPVLSTIPRPEIPTKDRTSVVSDA